jgi:hypothetical protein
MVLPAHLRWVASTMLQQWCLLLLMAAAVQRRSPLVC